MKKVDIIVPVYNAIEYTEECIKSVIKNTDLKNNELILINDKSPDENVYPMMCKYRDENKDLKITVLNNEKNLGFVGTVNKGMDYSKEDVILLNSDTEVTENWIEKIVECAYSSEYIATVTPLANNATIASVPNFGIDNELPKNMSLDEYAKMIEKISKARYPEITTGNGYCMFIKRSVINEIGLFDAKTFEKGFGEENDFCYRALDYGYTNVLCDNTFIYHKGTQSFKKENLTASRAELIDNHMKLLRNKYPIYVEKTDQFLAKNPLRDIHENVQINIWIHGKKRILYLVNEWEENMEMTGGTSLHLKDIIISNMKNNIASFVLAPNKYDLETMRLFLYTDEVSKEIVNFKTDLFAYGQIKYTNNKYKEILEILFDTFEFDILHVHHFLFQTFDSIDVAKSRNVYSIITLHDLYMKCPSINMVYIDKYCEYDERKNCEKCLNSRYGVNNNILENWQKTVHKVLSKFDKIIVPSENTQKIFSNAYKDLNFEVVEHGVNIIEVVPKQQTEKTTFDIAFVGAMAIHKGSIILKKLIKMNTDNIRIHLFGKPNDIELSRNTGNYINHGEYKRGDLPKLLTENNIDLVCIFATWPETYSYTLTECYMSKVPVLSFDIGAVGDRIEKDNLGWTMKFTTNTDEIFSKIKEISKDKEKYNLIKENFNNYKFKTVEEMQKYYSDLYNTISKKSSDVGIYKLMDYRAKAKEFEFNMYLVNYGHVVDKYERMRRTKLWKIAKKIKAKFKRK